jgi:hypothetical protein
MPFEIKEFNGVMNISLTPKGPETIFKPFLKFGQAIVEGHSYQKFMN